MVASLLKEDVSIFTKNGFIFAYFILLTKIKKMNSPVTIFDNILPQEVLNQIQQYLPVNENIRCALANYYDKLYDQKVIDEEAFEVK